MSIESPFNQCAGASCGELLAYSEGHSLTNPTDSDTNQARLDMRSAMSACEEGNGCVFLRESAELNDTVYQEGAQNA